MKFLLALCAIGALALLLSVGPSTLRSSDPTTSEVQPEVRESAWAWYEPEFIAWPCEKIETEIDNVHQPQIAIGPDEELVVQARGNLHHSVDSGRTWKHLCDTPAGDTSGVAVLRDGTFLVATNIQDGYETNGYTSPNYTIRSFTYRSEDRGQTWSQAFELDPWPYDGVGTDASIRFSEDEDGTIYYPVSTTNIARPGKPLPQERWYFAAQLYVSLDGGRTFRSRANMGKWTCESDILALGGGHLVSSIRYQTPGEGSWPRHKQTAIAFSTDSGRTWTTPRLVTGYLQQTACLVKLSDDTLVLPFGHKHPGHGQRFILSYDLGKTWSNTIFELNKGGLYASSVALKDDTIVTVFQARDRENNRFSKLTVLRWRVPSREVVSRGGFFAGPKVDRDRDYYTMHRKPVD